MSFQGRDPDRAGDQDVYRALSYALRDVLMEKWIKTQKTFYAGKMKRVYYLSLEFLVGRSLGNALINMGLMDEVTQALEQLGYDLERLRECEEDAALGNGGLGRLASCFMDSIATMKIPAYGYGIRYDFGLFNQKIVDGYQVETPDSWLRLGSPWMYERTSFMYPVQFYGHVTATTDKHGRYRARWTDTEIVMAMACDMLVPGFNNDHVINMRLWRAKASRELDLRSLQRRRLHRRRREQGQIRDHLQGPLSQRRHQRGPGTAPQTAVFLRGRHLPGHPPPLPQGKRDL